MLGRSAGVLDAAALLVRHLLPYLIASCYQSLALLYPKSERRVRRLRPLTCRQFPVLVRRARPIYPTHIHLIYCVFPRSPVQPITGRVILGRENSRLSQRPRKWGPVGDLLRPFRPLHPRLDHHMGERGKVQYPLSPPLPRRISTPGRPHQRHPGGARPGGTRPLWILSHVSPGPYFQGLTSGFFSSGMLPAWPSIAAIFAKLGICKVAFALDVSGRPNFCCRPQILAPTSVAVDPPSIAVRVSDAAASLFYSASTMPLSRGNNIKSLSRAPLSQGALLSCSLNSRPRAGCSRIIFIAKLPKTTKGPQSNADFVASF